MEITRKTIIRDIDADGIMRELKDTLSQMSVEQRAYLVIKSFLGTSRPSRELHHEFIEWLLDGNSEEVKKAACDRIFAEYLSTVSSTVSASVPGVLGMQAMSADKKSMFESLQKVMQKIDAR